MAGCLVKFLKKVHFGPEKSGGSVLKKTILFFSVDTVPMANSPLSGGGLRAWGLGEGLKSKGHKVIYSMPEKLLKKREGIPDEVLKYAYMPENLEKVIIPAKKPDCHTIRQLLPVHFN